MMKVEVIVHLKAKNSRIVKGPLGVFHVYITEPPLSGRANQAVRGALAEHFNVAKSLVELKSGRKSKNKIFNIWNRQP
ncbi:MAG: DUF167 domain-containing protein [Candidatus Doudnabacteria bacterium]|nr:DUF167 domain-containing protein [Candidatus Doudnabacteria bacterium]